MLGATARRLLAAAVGVILALLGSGSGFTGVATAGTREAGVHWILRTPWYGVAAVDRTMQVQLAVIDGYWRGEEDSGWYRSAAVYVLVRSTSRSADAVVREREVYDVTLHFGHGDTFSHSVRRGTATVQARVPSERFRINATFTTRRTAVHSCGGRYTHQRGRLSGTIRFAPSESTLRPLIRLSQTATLIHSGSGCGTLPLPDPDLSIFDRPCLTDGFGVDSQPTLSNDLQLLATRETGAPTATIRAFVTGPGHGDHLIVATLPAANVQVANDLTSVALRGERGLPITGTATAHADPAGGQVPAYVPSSCNGDATGVTVANSPFAGDLSVDFGFGGNRAVADGELDAKAFREHSTS